MRRRLRTARNRDPYVGIENLRSLGRPESITLSGRGHNRDSGAGKEGLEARIAAPGESTSSSAICHPASPKCPTWHTIHPQMTPISQREAGRVPAPEERR